MSMTDESDGFLIGLDRRAAGGGGLDIESHNSVFKSDVSCHLLVSRLVPSRSAVSLLE